MFLQVVFLSCRTHHHHAQASGRTRRVHSRHASRQQSDTRVLCRSCHLPSAHPRHGQPNAAARSKVCCIAGTPAVSGLAARQHCRRWCAPTRCGRRRRRCRRCTLGQWLQATWRQPASAHCCQLAAMHCSGRQWRQLSLPASIQAAWQQLRAACSQPRRRCVCLRSRWSRWRSRCRGRCLRRGTAAVTQAAAAARRPTLCGRRCGWVSAECL